MITTNYKISYFSFNFDRKSTYCVDCACPWFFNAKLISIEPLMPACWFSLQMTCQKIAKNRPYQLLISLFKFFRLMPNDIFKFRNFFSEFWIFWISSRSRCRSSQSTFTRTLKKNNINFPIQWFINSLLNYPFWQSSYWNYTQ